MFYLAIGSDFTSILSIYLLMMGAVFSFVSIFVMNSLNDSSIRDEEMKAKLEQERATKIARLYPKKSNS